MRTIAVLRDRLHLVAQAEPATDSASYGVAHSAQVFLIDPEGRLRLLYPFGSTARDMTEDIRALLAAAPPGRGARAEG